MRGAPDRGQRGEAGALTNPAASANTSRCTRPKLQSRLAKQSSPSTAPRGALRQGAKHRSALRPKANNRQTQTFSSSAHTSTTREFRSKFANTHCAVEAKRFLPHPRPTSLKQKLANATQQRREQTNIKQINRIAQHQRHHLVALDAQMSKQK